MAKRREFLEQFSMNEPNMPVQCNLTGTAYETNGDFPARLREILVDHMVKPVRFMENIRSMYDAGARVFIEAGPGSTLTSFVDSTLEGQPHWTFSANLKGRSPTLQFLHTLAFLASRGLDIDLRRLTAHIPSQRPARKAASPACVRRSGGLGVKRSPRN